MYSAGSLIQSVKTTGNVVDQLKHSEKFRKHVFKTEWNNFFLAGISVELGEDYKNTVGKSIKLQQHLATLHKKENPRKKRWW